MSRSPAVGIRRFRRPEPDRLRRAGPLVAALLLAAVNLRTAVTSVAPLLDTLEREIGLSSGLAGVLTTLPVLAFAGLGALTPRAAHRLGERRTLATALGLMTAGLFARAVVGSAGPFLLFSVVALAGGAVGNVLLPVLVKRHFPARIGPMTAAYTTVMAVGTTLAAALTVPIARLPGQLDWRVGLGSWGLLAGLATLVWVPLGVHDQRPEVLGERPRVPLRRSLTAWALAVFFGAQSLQAYVSFGWFALFFQERANASPAHAGLLVAALAGVQIPISLLVPAVAARLRDQRGLVVGLVGCYVIAYLGMLTAPGAADWLWVVLVGVGGGAFPLALTFIGLRSRTPLATAALSAYTQSIGYVLAGGGPLLVGVLHGVTGGWTWPFVLLFADLAVLLVAGWVVGCPRYVEDDLATAAGTAP